MKKSLILITVVFTVITLTSCSNMLEDLRNAKNKRNAKGNTGIEIKSTQNEKKKTNRVTITVDPGDKEIDKTGYVFTEPETNTEPQTKKEWKDAEEVFTDEGFKEVKKDSGKYTITADKNGDYTVAVKDKDGNTTYKTVTVDSIIPVDVSISVVSSKEKGSTVKAVIKKNATGGGEAFGDNSFDKDSFKIVCKDSSGNEITGVPGETSFEDGSMIITYTIPEKNGNYDITVECKTKEYDEVSLGNDFKIYPGPVFTETPVILEDNDKDGTAGPDGTYVLFGDWPQTVMPEKNTGIEVDESTAYEQGMFTYYRGQTSSGELAGWYVKQKEEAFEKNYKYSDDSAVNKSGTSERYFKLEPIKWRVLTEEYDHDNKEATGGVALLLAENILTAIQYYDGINSRTRNIIYKGTSGQKTVYSNNYRESKVRAWLNGYAYYTVNEANETVLNTTFGEQWDKGKENDFTQGKGFLQTAFSDVGRDKILKTDVDNSEKSTRDTGEKLTPATDYVCNDTTDKVFLLSEKEVTTRDYLFDDFYTYKSDSTRIRKVTDYAIATGAYRCNDDDYDGNGWWWLRSPFYYFSNFARGVNPKGNADSLYGVGISTDGVVPALSISLKGNTSNNGTASYTVKFDTDGGSVVPSQTVKKGEKVKEPENPEKKFTDTETGKSTVYAFLGWYDGDELYDFSAAVNDNLNLKAKWLEGFVNVEGSTVEGGDKFIYSSNTTSSDDYWKGVFREGRTVEIGDFYMCDHEVTQGEYEEYCLYGSSVPSDRYGKGKNYPAYYVSWYDAVIYCNLRSEAEGLDPVYYLADKNGNEITDVDGKPNGRKISAWRATLGNDDSIIKMTEIESVTKYCYAGGNNNNNRSRLDYTGNDDPDGGICFDQTANGYRLPTEAEWEYAALGGKEGVEKQDPDKWAGTNEKSKLKEYAWYKENSSSQTHIVKSDKVIGTDSANTLGLYDMNGNVWEWCWDWYDDENNTSITAATPATGVVSGSDRVPRGGSWETDADYCSVALRNHEYPSSGFSFLGFRVVRSAQ